MSNTPIIPPIRIPESMDTSPRTSAPPRVDHAPCPRFCIGATKIAGSVIACPLICPISCIAGTAYTMYHVARCDCHDSEVLDNRDAFCSCCGCGTALTLSLCIATSGIQEFNPPRPTNQPRVFHDMTR